jgi:hypothetical protein
MKQFFLIPILILFAYTCLAQNGTINIDKPKADTSVVSMSELREFMVGTVYTTFTVLEDGNISDLKIVRGIQGCTACDQEVLRVLSLMPKWSPGKQNGNL